MLWIFDSGLDMLNSGHAALTLTRKIIDIRARALQSDGRRCGRCHDSCIVQYGFLSLGHGFSGAPWASLRCLKARSCVCRVHAYFQ